MLPCIRSSDSTRMRYSFFLHHRYDKNKKNLFSSRKSLRSWKQIVKPDNLFFKCLNDIRGFWLLNLIWLLLFVMDSCSLCNDKYGFRVWQLGYEEIVGRRLLLIGKVFFFILWTCLRKSREWKVELSSSRRVSYFLCSYRFSDVDFMDVRFFCGISFLFIEVALTSSGDEINRGVRSDGIS